MAIQPVLNVADSANAAQEGTNECFTAERLSSQTAATEQRRFDSSAAALFFLLFALGCCAIGCKAYFFPDELLSYILANNSVSGDCATSALNWNVPLNGFFTPASAYFDTMLSASEHVFDYANVWHNQACDTHPPLYYALLHTLCSFCAGHFSRCCAGALNILFALLTLSALRALVRLFTDDRFVLTAISAVFAMSAAVLNSVACLRMYIMAMFWVTLYTYILVRHIRGEADRNFQTVAFFVTLCGTLTHYHCALYFALAAAVFAAYLLRGGAYRQLALFAATQLAALIAAYALFPAMSCHLLHGFHSTEFASNLTGADFTQRLCSSLLFFNNEIFGELLIVLIAATAVFCFIFRRRQNLCCRAELRGICIVAVPALLFTAIVSKTLPFADEYEHFRYFIPIFALLYAACLLPFFLLLKNTLDNRCAKFAIAAVAAAVIIGSWSDTDWDKAWLYRGFAKNRTQEFNDAVCVRIGTELMQYSYEFYRFAGQLWFPTVQAALESPAFASVMLNHDRVAVSFLEPRNISDEATDAALFQMLAAVGSGYKFSIARLPYFYDTLYPQRHQGCIYYLSRN